MAKNCQHCSEPNPEGFFNCPSCGKKASESKWNAQFVIRENSPWATAIRKDQIDFGTKDMNEHIKESQKKNLTPKLGSGDFSKSKGVEHNDTVSVK